MNAESEPLGPRAGHRLRRLGSSRRAPTRALLGFATVGLAALVIVIATGGAAHSPHAEPRLARGLVRTDGHAELRLAGMPQPPIGEVYEVWLTRPGSRPEATNALFTPTAAGQASVLVPGNLRGVREVTVTAEPIGGSSRPTSPVVLSVALSARASS